MPTLESCQNAKILIFFSFQSRYFQNYFEKNKTNVKLLWTDIRSIADVKVKTQFSNISHLMDNGTRVNDPVKMANLFNKYFVNVG